jgi:hypothetical protein
MQEEEEGFNLCQLPKSQRTALFVENQATLQDIANLVKVKEQKSIDKSPEKKSKYKRRRSDSEPSKKHKKKKHRRSSSSESESSKKKCKRN